jgi:hypothetical protein
MKHGKIGGDHGIPLVFAGYAENLLVTATGCRTLPYVISQSLVM